MNVRHDKFQPLSATGHAGQAAKSGGQLYIIQSGTDSTPQDSFQDVALTIKMPNPIPLDAAGRVPQFFFDNSINATIMVRLTDKTGVVQLSWPTTSR